MLTWLKANPLLAGIALAIALAIVFGTFKLIESRLDKHDETLTNQGVLIERGAANEEVINSVQKANDARYRPDAAAEQRVCEKYDRNCKDGQ